MSQHIDIIQAQLAIAQDSYRQEQYLEGCTDGAFGYPPQYIHEAYLQGYIEGIKRLPHTASGKIDYTVGIDPVAGAEEEF